jgi:hypothetical protein
VARALVPDLGPGPNFQGQSSRERRKPGQHRADQFGDEFIHEIISVRKLRTRTSVPDFRNNKSTPARCTSTSNRLRLGCQTLYRRTICMEVRYCKFLWKFREETFARTLPDGRNGYPAAASADKLAPQESRITNLQSSRMSRTGISGLATRSSMASTAATPISRHG